MFPVCVIAFAFINPHWCIISNKNKHISSQERLFRNGCATPKTTTFPIPGVLVFRISINEARVEDMSTKDNRIVDNN